DQTRDVTFVTTMELKDGAPDHVVTCPPDSTPYHELVAACDVVVMKLGYGAVSDCLANRVPMVYTTRVGFKEEDILAEVLPSLGPCAFLSQQDLFAGRLRPAIDEALESE